MATPPNRPDLQQLWRDRVREWYPGLLERTYFMPPVQMRRTRYEEEKLASGQGVLVSAAPVTERKKGQGPVLSESDVREDDCQQNVLNCLQRLSEEQKEVMFILSQLRFGDYLNEPSFAAAASSLPRPVDLKAENKHHGDFDVLIIHRRCGVLVGEIKSVGADKTFSESSEQKQDQMIKKRIEQAIKQLRKQDDVLQHIMSDIPQRPRVMKTLMLPNITREQLQRVLDNEESLRLNLGDCLGLDGRTDPTPLCLTRDVVCDPERLGPVMNKPRVTQAMRRERWWKDLLNAAGEDPNMTDDVYLELITRLAGPATTVKVYCSSVPRLAQAHSDIRTPGEAAEETGNRFTPAHVVLHPQQVKILDDPRLKLVFLTGPPGTGKSLMLLLKAQEWIRRGKPVHVISVGDHSLAASYMLAGQLERSGGRGVQDLVNFHRLRISFDRRRAVQSLLESAQRHSGGQELYVIMDEVVNCFHPNTPVTTLCEELMQHIPNLHIWTAAVHHKVKPPPLTEVRLTQALRSPPSVTDIVHLHRGFIGDHVKRYTDTPSPLPSYGPPTINIWHEGEGHDLETDTYKCEECGRNIARVLRELNVGGTRRNVPGCPPPLTNSDVFILTWGNFFQAQRDPEGKQLQPTFGILKGVSEEGYSVTVVDNTDPDTVRQVATNTGPDHVVVSNCMLVSGLERKIVVFVQHNGHEYDAEDWGKLMAISRCTSQLVWLRRPRPPKKKWPVENVVASDAVADGPSQENTEERQPSTSNAVTEEPRKENGEERKPGTSNEMSEEPSEEKAEDRQPGTSNAMVEEPGMEKAEESQPGNSDAVTEEPRKKNGEQRQPGTSNAVTDEQRKENVQERQPGTRSAVTDETIKGDNEETPMEH